MKKYLLSETGNFYASQGPLIRDLWFENGVVPVVLHINEANLEQYYMNMVEN